jgi:hypothetical protein
MAWSAPGYHWTRFQILYLQVLSDLEFCVEPQIQHSDAFLGDPYSRTITTNWALEPPAYTIRDAREIPSVRHQHFTTPLTP